MAAEGHDRAQQALRKLGTLPELQRLHNQLLQGERFTLVLGAGCSRHCGVPDFKLLRKLLVSAFSGGLSDLVKWNPEKVDESGFERLWHAAGPKLRHTTMSNWFLDRPPHLGAYYPLASLIQSGIFSTIVTYNVDGYLELALHSIGFDDFLVLINGCHSPEYVRSALDDDRGTRILKTHGDHRHRVYALSTGEILDFGERWSPMLQGLFKGKLLLVGYAGEDHDFLRSMPLGGSGEELWFANPASPPPLLCAAMERRSSGTNWIRTSFEELLTTLYYALSETGIGIRRRTRTRTRDTKGENISADLRILNTGGLHARPCALFIQTTARYSAYVSVTYKGSTVNGRSIMCLMMLAVPAGAVITVSANGQDAQEVLTALQELVSRKFDMEE